MQPPLILGGGPAGAAAATVIATAGRPVTLVERNAGPTDKLCGDFLSGAALAALHRLGLDPSAMGASPVRTIRLVHRRTSAESALPFPAMGLSRRSLDEALLHLAEQRAPRSCAARPCADWSARPPGSPRGPVRRAACRHGVPRYREARSARPRPPATG